MSNFLSRLFNSSDAPSTAGTGTATARRPARDDASSSHHHEPSRPRDNGLVWLTRDAGHWNDRVSEALARLRADWLAEPDASRWPDMIGLLDQLSAPPDEVIRQLPSTARDAMSLCDRENLPRAQLVDRLSKDPSLVQAILRQANGAFYGSGLQPILRVDAAIDRIGLAGTRAVVLAASVDALLSKPGGHYDSMQAAAWAHMVNTGPLARVLAPVFGADEEEAFAIALLHDVGQLIVFDRISTLRMANRRAVTLPDGWLLTLMQQLHEPLGAVAAHHWGLGDVAADAIGMHHRRDRPSVRHPMAETLFLAERAALAQSTGGTLELFGLWHSGELTADQVHSRGVLSKYMKVEA